jgi:DNA-binding transcriptional ArsR family regulator
MIIPELYRCRSMNVSLASEVSSAGAIVVFCSNGLHRRTATIAGALVKDRFVAKLDLMSRATDIDGAVSTLAAAIGEATRARILVSLMDGCSRTGTELVALTEVSPSTVSAHLDRLEKAHLVTVRRQGKNRYYSLSSGEVAALLERLSVLAGAKRAAPVCRAPQHLRAARTCYDHIAGTIGVALRDRFAALGWLAIASTGERETYELTPGGVDSLTALGINVDAARGVRRHFTFGCLDWTERRYHLGGALGATLLEFMRRRKWVRQDLDSRALRVTDLGQRELQKRFGVATP